MNQCHNPFEPPAHSQAFRNKLAALISPLRRVRSKTPFFLLPAHRIPTLWSLYRGLLRTAPTNDIKWRIRKLFEKNQHRTGTERTIKCLKQGYQWLDIFAKAKEGDQHLQATLSRYSRLIAAKREKEHWKQVFREELAWQAKLRNRPVLTGGFFMPSFTNGPLPRFNRQPHHIHRIIYKRRLARAKRPARQRWLRDSLDYLDHEATFEAALRQEVGEDVVPEIFSGSLRDDWKEPIHANLKIINQSYDNDLARSARPFPPELVEQILAARRIKIERNTIQRERERRGEIFPSTLRRKRQGPPAPVLARMTEEQKKIDKILRCPSEAGYVGRVKRKMGMKLKDSETWKKEDGDEQNRALLEQIEREIREENERRRRVANNGP